MNLHEEFDIPPPKAISEGGSIPDYDKGYYISEQLDERSYENN